MIMVLLYINRSAFILPGSQELPSHSFAISTQMKCHNQQYPIFHLHLSLRNSTVFTV